MNHRRATFLRFLEPALARILPPPVSAPLQAAHRDIHHKLHQAFRQAAAQQRPVRLAPAPEHAGDRLALRLPEGVRWGCPAAIPPPPDLDGTGWPGALPRALTVLPRRRATANVWFLHHGRSALCLRLGLRGEMEFLGYHPFLGTWRRL